MNGELKTAKRNATSRIKESQRTIATLKRLLNRVELAETHSYLNRQLFCLLSTTDLAIGLRDLLRSIDQAPVTHQQYYARVVAVTLWHIFDETGKNSEQKR